MNLKNCFFIILISSLSYNYSQSQNIVPFYPRFNEDVKGDMLLIGNNILNRKTPTEGPNVPYTAPLNPINNASLNMQYIDIDDSADTFSSSSADLVLPTTSQDCYKIKYAGLYWTAIYNDDSQDFNKVKIKVPGTGNYQNITADDLIFKGVVNSANSIEKTYVCYKDVTNIINPTDAQGSYTLANVLATTGISSGSGISNEGYCAGWSIFIIYEDPKLSRKSITAFDGFTAMSGIKNNNIAINGFRTNPVGPNKVKFAFSALGGDLDLSLYGDALSINGSKLLSSVRPPDNFFSGTIEDVSGLYNSKLPNSINTISYDAGIIPILNSVNSVIKNNDTSAIINLNTNKDFYTFFFTALATDIIEPKIIVTNSFKNAEKIDITNTKINFGERIYFDINFRNIGNDNANATTLKYVIPKNLDFSFPDGVDLSGIPELDISQVDYNTTTREILFKIPNSSVIRNLKTKKIRLTFDVTPNCNDFSDNCSNIITSQVFASYKGIDNTALISDEPSYASIDYDGICNPTPKPASVIIDISGCKFEKDIFTCDNNITLTAGEGYSNTSWSTSITGIPVIGTGQTLVVTIPGTYFANNNATLTPENCYSIIQKFNVVTSTKIRPTFNPVGPICSGDVFTLPTTSLEGIDGIWIPAVDNTITQTYTFTPNASQQCATPQTLLVIVNKLDKNITQINGAIVANQTNAKYQWVDCSNNNEIIPNETSQSYTPSKEGSYAVIISDIDSSCIEISDCIPFYTLSNSEYRKANFNFFPNPVKNKFKITGDFTVEKVFIYNSLGQKIITLKGNSDFYSLENLEDGIYMIELETDKGNFNSTIVKE
jgi:large repetitive protein